MATGTVRRPSIRDEMVLTCDDEDYVCQLYKRHMEDRVEEVIVRTDVDPLAVLATVVMEKHGLKPVCGPVARRIAAKFINYYKDLRRLEQIARKNLDHPLLAREAHYEALMAMSIVATIGYICYDRLAPEKNHLDAEIIDMMIRAKSYMDRCDMYKEPERRRQCLYNAASWLATGSDMPDLIESYLPIVEKRVRKLTGKEEAPRRGH